MAIKRRKRGNRVYLEEWKSTRRNGKVVSTFVRYIGLEGGERRASPIDRMEHGDAVHSGAVRLLWALSVDLHFTETIDKICGVKSQDSPSPGTMLTAWAINRVLDPESATQLEHWIPCTDIPALTGFAGDAFSKDAFLRSLDAVCHDEPSIADVVDHSRELDEALAGQWREKHPLPVNEHEVLAYDLTSVLFFGATCPLAAMGMNPDHQLRPQVNLAVAVSRHDHSPLTHFVYHGNRNGKGTMRNLLAELQHSGMKPGLLIVDRGLVGGQIVDEVRGIGWHMLGGVYKHIKDVRAVLDSADVPETPANYVSGSKSGGYYAAGVDARLFGERRRLTVYTGAEREFNDREERNRELSEAGEALTALSVKGADWSEARLHRAIGEILGPWKEYVDVRVSRKTAPRVRWSYRDRAIAAASKQDGRYLLLCTDDSMSAAEVLRAYMEKDFVEKVFRTLKTSTELEPVRHRRERRVRAYMFVCLLAYWLEVALRWRLKQGGVNDDELASYQERLLKELARVQRTVVSLGGQQRTWYLNVTDFIRDGLKRADMKDLLREETT